MSPDEGGFLVVVAYYGRILMAGLFMAWVLRSIITAGVDDD